MNRELVVVGVAVVALVVVAGAGGAFDPTLTTEHQHTAHTAQIVDVEYDDQHGVVWSLDKNGTFVGYAVDSGSVVATEEFSFGHSIAVGDGVVYIANRDNLWEYNVSTDTRTKLRDISQHASDMEYDEQHDVIWTAGHDTVFGYHADNGTLFDSHSAHQEAGPHKLAVNGEYVATTSGFATEVIVYDVSEESVAFEPSLPGNVTQTNGVHLTENQALLVGTDSGSGDSPVLMYDVPNEQQTVEYREHVFSISDIEYDEANQVIVAAGVDNTITFYDIGEDSLQQRYTHDDTIYATDLDTSNDLLWFGDGEQQPGTVHGIDVAASTPTATPTATPASGTDEPTATPTETATPGSTDTPTEKPSEAEESDDGGGLILVGAVLVLLVLAGGGYLLVWGRGGAS